MTEKQRANLEKGRQTMKAARQKKNAENFTRNTGRDPKHPVAGTQAWANKKNLPDDTKDMPR